MATPERSTPERQRQHGKTVAGIQIRTNNDLEMHAEDSRLSRLWEKFDDERLAHSIPDKPPAPRFTVSTPSSMTASPAITAY